MVDREKYCPRRRCYRSVVSPPNHAQKWSIFALCLFALRPEVARANELGERVQKVVEGPAFKSFDGDILIGDARDVLFERAAKRDRSWRWASVTKQVTAALIMAELDAGRFTLDDPLSKVLPAFTGAAREKITIRHLLQHTSGLPNPEDSAPGKDGVPSFYSAPVKDMNKAAYTYCAGTPKRGVGESFEYNNCDYLVLGAVLQRIRGSSYSTIVRERIAKPLGLKSLQLDLNPYGASGALSGTARELLIFDRALMSNKLVSKASTAAMWTGDPKLGYAALGAWSFPAKLEGCAAPVALVERRGAIGALQVRNVLAPEQGRAVIVFTEKEGFEFGEIWQGQGALYELLSAALCDRPISR